MARADGSLFWAELRGRPVLASDSHAGTIWTVSDVSAQVDERETLAWSATHDLLTGLSNRRGFLQVLEQLYESRASTGAAELIVIDLDRFKPINDQAGHAAGDAMLKLVAAAISARVRASDLVVRTGGDEFAVLLAGCHHEAALRIAEAIRSDISGIELCWDRHRLCVGASLGVASLKPDTVSVGAWLAAADEACYAAKAEGRGLVRSASRPFLMPPPVRPTGGRVTAALPGPATAAT
jgi:diguanylate cyclase (GGDEF)-like protein